MAYFFLRRHVLFLCHNYIIAEGQKLLGPLVKLTCYLLCFELEVIQKFVTIITKFACPSTYLKNNVFFYIVKISRAKFLVFLMFRNYIFFVIKERFQSSHKKSI